MGMTLQRPIATSFNGGELSPRMGGRVDTAIWAVGMDTCENFVPTVEGALVKRPGFEYIRPAATTASWLTEFRFNLTQDYVIEWSDYRLRFYTNGGRIETAPGVPYEVIVPYTAAEAPYVSFQQSYDRLYLDHENHPPARLTRTSGSTFVYDVAPLVNGPFSDQNVDETRTVTVSAATGAGITIAASSPIFLAGHVGALFKIEAADFSTIPAWEVGIDAVAVGSKRRSDGKVYVAASAGRTGTSQPIHTSGTEWDGSQTGTDINGKGPFGVQWTYLHDRYGIVSITAVAGDGLSATADVVRRLPDSVTSVATFRWSHAAFSAAAGWPSVVLANGGRLCHFKQFELLASVSGDYLNHVTTTSSGLLAGDLAFRRTLSTEDPVLWAVGDRKIVVGTASREIAIGAINSAQAIGGDNIEAVPQSFYGSDRVFPVQIGTAGIFVQRSGRKLRQAQYDFGQDRYIAENMTVWCRHITRGGVLQLAYQKEPEELLFGVRGDGQLLVHPHAPEQQIKGFSRIIHGDGTVLSATTIANADGRRDEVWVLVRRADGVKSVQRMAAWRDDGDPISAAFFVDSGTTATAAAGQTHFTGATHLANKAVAVLADGGVVDGVTVAAEGSFDIPASVVPQDRAYTVTVGVRYTAAVVTLPPELKSQTGTSQGVRQRIVRLALRLIETAGLKIGVQGGKLDNLIDRPSAGYMDAPVPLFTGDTERPVSGGWDRSGRATFTSSEPLPAVIVAALPKIEVTG
ncbi:hypothetical protein [Sphingomonas sp. BE137]|uniref:hypothetical protein n=1 Tax=Sphingomonas sp. BE137 TaxID=2817844 RepID=UPI001AE1A463|nr:hypothetical protein [Sphingomonas sp. BE137]MDR6847180.1 hypothetical protein [Sphingomonas sp. BE137]